MFKLFEVVKVTWVLVARKYSKLFCIFFFRYCKNPDVRVDLYEAIDEWVSAIPEDNKFLCGDKPNLADIVSLIFNYN